MKAMRRPILAWSGAPAYALGYLAATEASEAINTLRATWGDAAAERAEELLRATVYRLETCCELVDEAEYLRSQPPNDLTTNQQVRLAWLTGIGA